MKFDYDVMPLFKNYKIALSKKHRFTTDAVLLYDFSKVSSPRRLCDLCSGTGIVGLLHNYKSENPPQFTRLIEIEEEAVCLIEKTLKINGNFKIEVLKADIITLKRPKDSELFDTVTCNPPYFKINTGKTGNCINARQEILCNMDDVCSAADKLLKFGGKLFVCQRPQRLCDVLVSMRKFKIEPKRLRVVYYDERKEPFLILVEGKKGAKSEMKVMSPLYITKNGEFTSEYKKIATME